ncbi:SART-1 protein [Cladochytrium replicatum]|nr:SART-1 protein [Cladochytrium replicatum]
MADDEQEIALSIEETNKLRAQLGLKPLKIGKDEKVVEAEKNFEDHKNEQKHKAEVDALKQKIEKAQNKRKLNKKLTGKTLGEASDDEGDDPMAWIQKQRERERQRQKALAEKKAKELESMDNGIVYDAANLKGLRVAHKVSDIQDAGETVLVLKDSTIEENEEQGDELVSIALAEKEALAKNLENKTKKPGYVGYDDDEFNNPNIGYGQSKGVLTQYDEEILGRKKDVFELNEFGGVHIENPAEKRARVAEALRSQGVVMESLENERKGFAVSMEFVTDEKIELVIPEAVKMKKKKRKPRTSAKTTRVHEIDFDEEGKEENESAMDVDTEGGAEYRNSNAGKKVDDVNFVDDEDLQAALGRQRRMAVNKATKSKTVEELLTEAKDLANETSVDDNGKGMEFSATAEFIRALSTVPVLQGQRRPAPAAVAPVTEKAPAPDQLQPMEVDQPPVESSKAEKDDAAIEAKKERERLRERGGWAAEAQEDGEVDDDDDEEDEDGNVERGPLEDEPLVAKGLGATVALLLQKGFVHKTSSDVIEKERRQREKSQWLLEQKKRELEKELAKQKLKEAERKAGGAGGSKQKGREREWELERERDRQKYREDMEERERMREVEERFKNYAPDIQLEYHDEFGRALGPKEAFKQLSHRFHGKTPGKMKREKQLRKIAEEMKLSQMSSADTPLGTAVALSGRTEQAGTAHVILTKGNRSVLPAEVSLADVRPGPSRASTKKAGTKKGTAKGGSKRKAAAAFDGE